MIGAPLKHFAAYIPVGLGILFLVTGCLKAQVLITDPVKTELIGISSTSLALVVQLEFVLGLWLISGNHRFYALMAAMCFFVVAAYITGKQVYEKQPTCPCFGPIDIDPVYTFSADVLVLALLVYCTPWAWRATASDKRSPNLLSSVSLYVLLLTSLLALSGLLGFVDFSKVVRSIRGEVLELSPRVVDFGHTTPGVRSTQLVSLINRGDAAVRIVGGYASCGCMLDEDFPLTVPPRSIRQFRISIIKERGEGQFRQRYVVNTDQRTQPVLHGGLVGTYSTGSKDVMHSHGR